MNIHSNIKKYTDDYKDVISDNEIFAVGRSNRYIGELSIAEAFTNLLKNKQKLTIQDYEFYSNIPAYTSIIANERKTAFLVENYCEATALWAANFSVSILLKNRNVVFVNNSRNLQIDPSTAFAKYMYTKVALHKKLEDEGQYYKVCFLDAEDSLIWNSKLEQAGKMAQFDCLVVKNFNKASVVEEPSLISKAKLTVLQSIAGWALLFRSKNIES